MTTDATNTATNPAPALYVGTVKHTRNAPLRHAFAYPTYQWFVDLDQLPRLRWPLSLLGGFSSRDHLGDPERSIRANVDAFTAAHGIDLRGGRVVMLAQARVLGYVFNPLSVYWCHRPDGELACVIAEVHNTYGQRHCYLLRADDAGLSGATEFRAPKEFYVSPFFDVSGEYRMTLPLPDERLALSISLSRDGQPVFVATLRGSRRPATTAQLCRAALRYGWSTALVSLRIRAQGIKLWLRGLPVQPRPPHPPGQQPQHSPTAALPQSHREAQ